MKRSKFTEEQIAFALHQMQEEFELHELAVEDARLGHQTRQPLL